MTKRKCFIISDIIIIYYSKYCWLFLQYGSLVFVLTYQWKHYKWHIVGQWTRELTTTFWCFSAENQSLYLTRSRQCTDTWCTVTTSDNHFLTRYGFTAESNILNGLSMLWPTKMNDEPLLSLYFFFSYCFRNIHIFITALWVCNFGTYVVNRWNCMYHKF